jgi:tetratricopeptide (TPR) repeat protein
LQRWKNRAWLPQTSSASAPSSPRRHSNGTHHRRSSRTRLPTRHLFRGKQNAAVLEDRYDKLLKPLTDYSLVSKDTDQKTYSIHRMVQAVVQDRMPEDERPTWVKRTVNAVNRVFLQPNFENWSVCDRLMPHARVCIEHIERETIETQEAGRLLNQMALFLQERGQYTEAEPLYNKALEIKRSVLSEGHTSIAIRLNNLAGLYQDQGLYAQAEPLMKEALEIFRQALGENHPHTQTVARNYQLFLAGRSDRY